MVLCVSPGPVYHVCCQDQSGGEICLLVQCWLNRAIRGPQVCVVPLNISRPGHTSYIFFHVSLAASQLGLLLLSAPSGARF